MSNQPYELSTEKQGHRVLCCCDSRKAVLIISGVALIEAITNLVIALKAGALAQHWTAVISVFFYFLVVWAAINYHRGLVIVSLLWQFVAFCILIAGLSMAITRDDDNEAFEEMSKSATTTAISIGIFVKLVIMYAYGAFISEVGSGVMSPQTHDREKYSCCCNV